MWWGFDGGSSCSLRLILLFHIMSFYLWEGNSLQSREDLENAHNQLLEPLLDSFSSSGARVRISHFGSSCTEAAAELEGFLRPLWGIVPYVHGGGQFSHWEIYRRGLVNGCNPNHPHYWGTPVDFDQILVDMAAVAHALCFCKQQFWDGIPMEDQQIVVEYLRVVREKTYCHNNWKFFGVLVDLALESVGETVNFGATAKLLDDIESLYLGGGWYGDGKAHRIDYYNGFAFHFYSLIYVLLLRGKRDHQRCNRFVERAVLFAHDYIHWFADGGASLPYGRSLNYKFAVVGFWGVFAAVIDPSKPPFPWGVLKGLYMRHLRWWSKQPVLQRDSKILTLGYCYPNVLMTERYNSPQSPYWATKCFSGLFLKADHPFWTSSEEPLRLSDKYLPTIGFQMVHYPKNTVALVNGPWNDEYQPEKYSKFAYSTRYAFGVITNHRTFPLAHLDNMLAFSFDNKTFYVREAYQAYTSDNGAMVSRWTPFPDVHVETWMYSFHGYHVRVHHIQNNTSLTWLTREGGFAISDKDTSSSTSNNTALVRSSTDYSAIQDAEGLRNPVICKPEPNCNVAFPKTFLPQLTGEIAHKCNVTYTCYVYANTNGVPLPIILPISAAQPSGPLSPVVCNQ